VLNKQLLATITFPAGLTAVTMNVTETLLFVGAINGSIYRVDFFQRDPPRGYIPIDRETHVTSKDDEAIYLGHKLSISSLAISMDASTLISGSEDGLIHVWDIQSRQILRSFTHHKGRQKNRSPFPRMKLSIAIQVQ
jgi:pre-rRNA-processing protein IPI3